MAMQISTEGMKCVKCGKPYPKIRTNFPTCYAILYKGLGHIPICKACIDNIYRSYLSQCNDPRVAVRQVCRKLDLYWDDTVYDVAEKISTQHSIMLQYISKLTIARFAGKSYDDTLVNEGTLWEFPNTNFDVVRKEEQESEEPIDIDEETMAFWGPGYTPAMYAELEQRRSYWMSKFPEDLELDIGTEAIIRQICSLELDINRDRAAGRSVEKSINALNTLLGSANLKPAQKRDDADSAYGGTPLGVWLYRFENKRPIPDTYDDSKILKYVFTWMGHLCKMMGIKGNKYTKLYEDEVKKYTVDKPEYEGEDDEEAFLDELEKISMDDES